MWWSFSVLFKDKLPSELNLTFMKSFSYSPVLMEFHLSRFLVLFQSSVYFIHSSLFLSVETRVKYLFHFLFNVSICVINNQVQRAYNVNFYIIRIFHTDITNVIKINIFVWLFVCFSKFGWNILILIIAWKNNKFDF